MISFISFMLGSKLGRYVIIVALVAFLLTIVYWKIYNKGVVSVELKQTEKAIGNVLDKLRADEEVFKLDTHSRRIRLRRWANGEAE